MSKRKPLNTNIPEDLSENLTKFCEEFGYNKTQVVIAALNQYLVIKQEEKEFKQLHPDRRVKTTVNLEAVAREEEPHKMASVLIY